jgi:sulfate adenylyltransferase/3'-phosphoadenosine 5'-phosphosulfate synthase
VSRGFVLWFTGLSGSGKSTLTAMVTAELRRRGVHVEALDGDEVRKNLSKGLGFSKEDRDTNVRRLGFVANLIARSGGCAVAAAISPYRAVREEVRRGAERFCEVYCDCPVSVLAERDPKGLYKKALRGEIKDFTGVDAPYEPPDAPEVHLHTDRESPEASAALIVARLEELGLLVPGKAEERGLVLPHGGELVERLLSPGTAAAERRRAEALPRVTLDAVARGWLWGFATGALSPLAGYVGEKDYLRIVAESRLERGLFWPVPPLLSLRREEAAAVAECREVALQDQLGQLLGTMQVSESWSLRPAHGETRHFLAGDVAVLDLGLFHERAVTASAIRARLAALDHVDVLALASAGVPSLALEHVARVALELTDALVLLHFASPGADPDAAVDGLYDLADQQFATGRLHVAPFQLPASDPQAAGGLVAIMAQNFGASRLLLGSAGGALTWPAAARELAIAPAREAPVPGWGRRAFGSGGGI